LASGHERHIVQVRFDGGNRLSRMTADRLLATVMHRLVSFGLEHDDSVRLVSSLQERLTAHGLIAA